MKATAVTLSGAKGLVGTEILRSAQDDERGGIR
jgi:hypothetical protein